MSSSAPEEPANSEGVQIVDVTPDVGSVQARAASIGWEQPVRHGSSIETAIVLEVTAALLVHPPTELTVIEVNNRQGVVTLKGQVGSVQFQAMAGEIASRHPEVDAMVNALEIRERAEQDHRARV